MMRKGILILGLLLMLMFAACSNDDDALDDAPEDGTPADATTQPEEQLECPETCDDGKACTDDTCGEETNYECVFTYRENCCGNEECEETETYRTCPADCPKPGLPSDLQELINTAENKVTKNLRYTLKGPKAQGVYTYWVYNDKIRIDLPMYDKYKGFQYTRVYLDLKEKTATGYCHTITWCDRPESSFEFDYEDYVNWIPTTPLDKLEEIDNGEVVETVSVDRKESKGVRYINAQGKEEKIWLWTYYGVPLKYTVENDEGELVTYEYRDLVVNTLSKSDVEIPE